MLSFLSPFSTPDDDIMADCHSLSDDVKPYKKGPSTEPYLPAEMRRERSRLQTFHTWPETCARKLARYGFYASREGDCVRCAFCGLEVSDFSSPQDVKLWHWQVAGKDCPLLTGEGDVEETKAKVVMARTLSKERALKMETRQRSEHAPLLTSTPGGLHVSGTSGLRNPSTSLKTSHSTRSTSLLSDSSSQHRTPRTSPASDPRVLKSGAGQRHRQGRVDSARSTPFNPTPASDTSPSSTQARTTPSSSTPFPSVPPSSPAGGTTWADIVRTARSPDMVAYQARLQSFTAWPLVSPSPRELARAGFFRHTIPSSSSSPAPARGPGCSPPAEAPQACTKHGKDPSHRAPARSSRECHDTVWCFWCGERIHRWQRSDDPVLEHARLSPACRYVIQLLGRQLHHDVITASARATDSRRN